MPRKKTPQEFYGLHLALAPELGEYINARGYIGIFHRTTTLLLLRIARHPEILSYYQRHADDIKSFGSLFTKHPDEILDVLCFMRKTLAEWKKDQAGFIRIFLRTHATVKNAKGELVSIGSLTDGELAQHLTDEAGFNITTASVKWERQKIAKVDKSPIGFYEHPEAQQFMRDGVRSPALERLLLKFSKGKTSPP
jgi:hypothetical protein